MKKIKPKHVFIAIIVLKIALIAVIVFKYLPSATVEDLRFSHTFFWFVLAGFLAQVVDGALGMAYGVTSTSILLGFGQTPRLASAAVHTAEVFTTGVSGLSHIGFGNFDKRLFLKLFLPGVISAFLGAYILGNVIDGNVIKPYITAYLMILGILILRKARKKNTLVKQSSKYTAVYAALGGFLDAIGGGGWGPIVTSNLIKEGLTPNKVIGTVNTTEFFVTFCSSGVLIYFSGIQSWQIILGLIVGGVLAAPLGASLLKKIPKQRLLVLVGCLIVVTSLYGLFRILFN